MLKAHWFLVSFILGLALIPLSAKANPIGPGGSGPPDGFSLAYSDCPGNVFPCPPPRTVVAKKSLTWGSGNLTGQFYEQVEKDPTNPFCSGCLDFLFQLENTSLTQSITRITYAGFSGYQTDVGYDVLSSESLGILCGIDDGGFCNSSIVPNTVDRSSNVDNGNVVGFNFSAGVSPGNTTLDLVIETNATSFVDPLLTVFGKNGDLATLTVSGPSGPPFGSVPEPSTLLFLATGLFGLLGLRKKVNI